MTESELAAGSIILIDPFAALWYCATNSIMPSFLNILYVVTGTITLLATQSRYSHVIQYMGNNEFIHSYMGSIVLHMPTDFPPGYLETAHIIPPPSSDADVLSQAMKLFRRKVGRPNTNPFMVPATFVYHWARKAGFVDKLHRVGETNTNCVVLLLWTWLEAGVDLLKDREDLCYVGVYPRDIPELVERAINKH
jgi:hypothetical protein